MPPNRHAQRQKRKSAILSIYYCDEQGLRVTGRFKRIAPDFEDISTLKSPGLCLSKPVAPRPKRFKIPQI